MYYQRPFLIDPVSLTDIEDCCVGKITEKFESKPKLVLQILPCTPRQNGFKQKVRFWEKKLSKP